MKPAIAHTVFIEPTFEDWRQAARVLLANGTPPGAVNIDDKTGAFIAPLFAADAPLQITANGRGIVPKAFVDRARMVACHRAPERWNLLYRILWRLQSERNLLRIDVDEDVAEFRRLEHQVKYDLHKMYAFVRFRKLESASADEYVAWYEPAHRILTLAAPFFAERFAVMRWAILTPDASIQWDPVDKKLTFGPGTPRESAPQDDDYEALWRTYYRSIFNPARTNLNAMRSEMPTRYWKNLPEIDTLPELLKEAGGRVASMLALQPKITAAAFLPQDRSLPVLRQAIQGCHGCELYRCATQPVFGRGPAATRMMLIGEQPGDEEDRSGEPFIGPAGRLLETLFREAGIDRTSVYVTNAVKHFKFKAQGKRRLHENPRASEIFACRPWLLAELEAVHPEIVVCLGASAAKSIFGASFALMRERGRILKSPYVDRVIATIHPAAILRATDPARADEMRAMLLSDLQLAVGSLQ